MYKNWLMRRIIFYTGRKKTNILTTNAVELTGHDKYKFECNYFNAIHYNLISTHLWVSSGMSQGFQQVEIERKRKLKIIEKRIFINQAIFWKETQRFELYSFSEYTKINWLYFLVDVRYN